jgi:hypothetical protein
MKNLTLKDGTVLQMEDVSNIGAFRFPVNNYAEVDTIKSKLTKENLSEITVGVVDFTNVINESINVQMDDNGNIVAIFLNRMGTNDIIQDAIDSYTLDLLEGGIL